MLDCKSAAGEIESCGDQKSKQEFNPGLKESPAVSVAHPAQWRARLPQLDAGTICLVILGLAPLLAMLAIVLTHWLPLPYWDEWASPGRLFAAWYGGTLTWRDFFEQHNESRGVFARMLHLLLVQFGGWDVRREMALLFASVCAITILFYKLMRRIPGATTRSALITWSAATVLCFSAVQLDNFLWATLLGPFVPGLGLMAIAVVNTSQLSFRTKCLLNALVALLATYTFVIGLLLWALGVPTLAPNDSVTRRKMWLWYAVYGLCGAIAVGVYFIGYIRPTHHPKFFPDGTGFTAFAHYLLLWIGGYFRAPGINPLAVGMTAAIIFAVALISVGVLLIRTHAWRPFYGALLITAYACITAGTTAAGRIGFGVEQAMDARYRTFSVFFYLAIVALLFALWCSHVRNSSPAARRAFLAGCSVAAIAALIAWTACYVERMAYLKVLYGRNIVLLRALEWIDVIPDNPDLLYLYPRFDQLIERTQQMREHNLLRLQFVKPHLARRVRQGPPAKVDDSFGTLETCTFQTTGNLYITGWARLPYRNLRSACIVIGARDASGAFKPISVMEIQPSGHNGEPRLVFGRAFNPANLPPGEITISAWAVDLLRKKAHPLGGARTFTADHVERPPAP
ncbi:MAG TPA: hypothetical protein VK993_04340 [Chthoniobacterales bacterium]|nr:hypothetical protein [Chthoniobacterales bacterium]